MEILAITWNYPPRRGGMEQLLASLCDGLRKNHRVSVITAYADKPQPAEERKVFRPGSPGLPAFFLYAFGKGASLLRGKSNVQIIFGGSALVTPIVLLLARLFRRKAVVQAHGLDLIYRSPVYQFFAVRWLRRVDLVIANSRYTAGLARAKGVHEKAIAVIPPGVDCERFHVEESADALKKDRELEGKRIVLFVGRLARRKGVKEFIERSLLHIVEEVPDACFVIVGANPTESLAHHDDVAGAIRQTIARLNLFDHVRWLGGVSDEELVKVYGLCDVLVLPVAAVKDDVEGFGIVALEAAAAGKPVVATGVGGIPDAVSDRQSGILVDAGDYDGLNQAVISLLKNPDLASTMGEHGRRRVVSDFAWGRVVARYEAEFSRLVGGNNSAAV